MKNGRGRIVIILLFALAGLAGLSVYWVPRYFEAAWFLEDIAAGSGDSTWKTLHKPPVHSAVTWTIEGRTGGGDLYTPAEPAKGRMVFVPGLVENARTDPRVVAFAETLARAGFVTLVPEAAAFEDLRAGPSDIVTVTDAALWLSDADLGPAPKTKIGITALSYMAGPSIIAAARQPLAGRVGFVFFIGGYYEAADVVRFVTTRKYRLKPGEPWREQPPADYALWAFLKANALSLDNPADRAALTAIAEARLKDPAADIAGLTGGLGPDGQAVFALISNRDPDKVEALIAALPASMRARFDALDPSRQDLSGFEGEALLVHGKDDPLIASTESEKLAAALGSRAHLYVLEQVTHVEVNRPASMWDQLDLLFAGRRLLSYRD